MEISHETIQYPDIINAMPNKSIVNPMRKIFLEFMANYTPFGSRDLIFSRIASTMNSERFLYPSSGLALIISSTFLIRGSGTLTVVYVVAMGYPNNLFKITLGSNTVVLHSNELIGVVY